MNRATLFFPASAFLLVLGGTRFLASASDWTMPAPHASCRPDGRRLVWQDEFDGNALDESKWQTWGTMSSTDNIYVNDERTVQVADGLLRLRVLPSGVTNKVAMLPRGLVTRDRMAFRYGYLEMRARVPYRRGAWPSFWLQSHPAHSSADWMSEIDILESFAYTGAAVANLHKWRGDVHSMLPDGEGSLKRAYIFPNPETLNSEFHVYAMDWTPEAISFLVDGECFMTIAIDDASDFAPEPIPGMAGFHDPHYVILNNEVFTPGHGWCPEEKRLRPEDNPFPIDYEIDWVRLWQREGEATDWPVDVTFGAVAASPGYEWTNVVASVVVEGVSPKLKPGAMLRMAVEDASGAVLGVIDRRLAGPGEYRFDTAGAIPGAAFASGVLYTCAFFLVDAGGCAIATSPVARLPVRLCDDFAWFSAAADCDLAVGGTWRDKPVISGGAFVVEPGGGGAFAASGSCDGIVRIEAALSNCGYTTGQRRRRLLGEYAVDPPLAAIVAGGDDDVPDDGECGEDGALELFGLALEGDAIVWKRLEWAAAPTVREACLVVMECDLLGDAPRVSYLAALAGCEPVRLRDDSGAEWFDSPGRSSADGDLVFAGHGRVDGFAGTASDKSVAEAGGVRYASLAEAISSRPGERVSLLTNAMVAKSLAARADIYSAGHELMLYDDALHTLFFMW